MQNTPRSILLIALAVLLSSAAFALPAEAAGFSVVRPGGRGGNWEFSLPFNYIESSTVSGQGGSSADLSSDLGFGFGLAYNVDDKLNLGFTMTWSDMSYRAQLVNSAGTADYRTGWIENSSVGLTLTYNLSADDLTPYVSAGVGVTMVDTNIPTGPPSSLCWWDPWWGYICSTYVPTKTESDMSYSAGFGVRWDVTDAFTLRAGYHVQWIDFKKATGGIPDFPVWRFDLVFPL